MDGNEEEEGVGFVRACVSRRRGQTISTKLCTTATTKWRIRASPSKPMMQMIRPNLFVLESKQKIDRGLTRLAGMSSGPTHPIALDLF
jgi:hypothetical protein